jgi:hypothetical protein
MGLIGTTTAEQYYTSSQKFITSSVQATSGDYQLTVSDMPQSEGDFFNICKRNRSK